MGLLMVVPPAILKASFSLSDSFSTSLTVLIRGFLMAGFDAAFFADFFFAAIVLLDAPAIL
jgi:hypothetical protein